MSTVRILLVDDRQENLLALEAILQETGHVLVRAGSGAEALKAVLRDDFALILMDVAMPDLDGYETVELIRRRERSKYTPVIFLTANLKSETHVFRGYSVGAPSTTCSSRSCPRCSCRRSRCSSSCSTSNRRSRRRPTR
jgi:CheY-like chemotaxis protein